MGGFSSESLTGEGPTSECMWLLPGFNSLQVVGLRPQLLAGCWPEASLNSLLCGPLYRADHNMAADFIRANQGDSLLTKQKLWTYIT